MDGVDVCKQRLAVDDSNSILSILAASSQSEGLESLVNGPSRPLVCISPSGLNGASFNAWERSGGEDKERNRSP